MSVSLVTEAQRGGCKTEILTWRFGNIAPFTLRDFSDHDPDKRYIFRCKIEGCDSTEFESMGGGLAICDCCETEYAFTWA